MCVKGFSVLVLVLYWTQCLPQGVGAPPDMLRGRTAGFPKNCVAGPRRGGIDGYNLYSNHTPPPTVAHQPRACCIRLVPVAHIILIIGIGLCFVQVREMTCIPIILENTQIDDNNPCILEKIYSKMKQYNVLNVIIYCIIIFIAVIKVVVVLHVSELKVRFRRG